MKCCCFRTFSIVCSTTGFRYWHTSCSALINDSGSSRSWFGRERVVRGWGGPERAKGLQSRIYTALIAGNTESSHSSNAADKGTISVLEQHHAAEKKRKKGSTISVTWGKICELTRGFKEMKSSSSMLGFNHDVHQFKRGNVQKRKEMEEQSADITTLQATEFGVHIEKLDTLTVVVGADTRLGDSIAKRLHASLRLTVNDIQSTHLLSKPGITSVLRNVETVIFSPILSEREGIERGWLNSLFSPSKRINSTLQDKDVEEFLKRCGQKLSRVICLSTIGANRVGSMPFTLRNVGGDLDTKRAIEQAVIRGSQEDGGMGGVNMACGDALEGKTTRTLAEDAVLQSLQQKFAGNTSFSIISTPVDSSSSSSSNSCLLPDQIEWDDLFLKLEPELLRVNMADLDKLGNAATISHYIQQILFNPPTTRCYVSVNDERKQAQDARERGDEFLKPLQASSGLQGGIYIVVEPDYGRVRLVRSKKDPEIILKEMSEHVILEDFKKHVIQAATNNEERGRKSTSDEV